MRLKLVCILGAVLFLFVYMCSCVANPDSGQVKNLDYSDYSEYKIEKVASYKGSLVRVFKITTPSETFLVAESPKGTFTLLK